MLKDELIKGHMYPSPSRPEPTPAPPSIYLSILLQALSLVMILSMSGSSQSRGGQISLISLDLYKKSIPLKDEGRSSFPLPARS